MFFAGTLFQVEVSTETIFVVDSNASWIGGFPNDLAITLDGRVFLSGQDWNSDRYLLLSSLSSLLLGCYVFSYSIRGQW